MRSIFCMLVPANFGSERTLLMDLEKFLCPDVLLLGRIAGVGDRYIVGKWFFSPEAQNRTLVLPGREFQSIYLSAESADLRDPFHPEYHPLRASGPTGGYTTDWGTNHQRYSQVTWVALTCWTWCSSVFSLRSKLSFPLHTIFLFEPFGEDYTGIQLFIDCGTFSFLRAACLLSETPALILNPSVNSTREASSE